MNSAIEWHDSDLVAIKDVPRSEGEIVIDAYVHRSDGKPGETPGDGGYQRVRMSMRAMRVEGQTPELPGLISHGALVLEGVEHVDLLPLPMHFDGSVSFTLTMRDGTRTLVFAGAGLTVEADGDFRFVEKVDFSGS